MKIKHIDTASLIDFPGNIASVIFCGGCNFDCDYCFNRGLVEDIDQIPTIPSEECLRIIDEKKPYIDGVVISGGEPTIQSELVDFIKELRKRGYKVKIDTNGYNPEVLRQLINERLVQYIAMDIKAPLNYYEEVTCNKINIDRIGESIQLIKSSHIKYEFRSTVWKNCPIHRHPEELRDILSGVNRFYLQNFDDKLESGLYESMSKHEIQEVVSKLEDTAKHIELRGVWR